MASIPPLRTREGCLTGWHWPALRNHWALMAFDPPTHTHTQCRLRPQVLAAHKKTRSTTLCVMSLSWWIRNCTMKNGGPHRRRLAAIWGEAFRRSSQGDKAISQTKRPYTQEVRKVFDWYLHLSAIFCLSPHSVYPAHLARRQEKHRKKNGVNKLGLSHRPRCDGEQQFESPHKCEN